MTRLFLIANLLAGVLILNSCKKGSNDITGGNGNEDPPGTETVTLADQKGKPYELISLEIEKGSLTEESYTGDIDGEELTFVTVDASSLMFIVPDLTTETYTVELEIENTVYSFDVEVEEEKSIPDADQYLDEYISAIISDPDYAAVPELDEAIRQFDELSEEDQMTAARFIANNSVLLDNLEQELDAYHSLDNQEKKLKGSADCDFYCLAAQFTKIAAAGILLPEASALVGTIGALAIGIDIGYSILTGKRSFLLSRVKTLAGELLSWTYWPQIKTAEITFSKVDELILELDNLSPKLRSGAMELEENYAYPLRVSNVPYRTVNAEDINSSNSVVSSLVETYNTIREIAETHFDFKLPGYNDITEVKPVESLNQITLSVDGNDVEISDLAAREDHYLITFGFTDQSATGDKYFSLTAGYSYRDFTYKNSFVFTLKAFTCWNAEEEMPGEWILRVYKSDARAEIYQDDRKIFNADGTWEAIENKMYGNDNGWTDSNSTGTWSYSCSLGQISWRHDYWTNIEYRFDVDQSNTGRMPGYCVGLCNDGYNRELIRQ